MSSNIRFGPLGGSDNAWAAFDTSGHDTRVLDAWGPLVTKFNFQSPLDVVTTNRFTVTAVGSSSVVNHTTAGGGLLFTTGGTEYDGINMQALGTNYDLASGKPTYFGFRVAVSDATQSDILIGLAGTDTTLLAASAAHAVAVGAGFAGFYKLDAVTQSYFASYQTTTVNNLAAAGTLDTDAHWYTFEYYEDALYGFLDGELVSTFTDDLPTVALTPSFAIRTGAGAAITASVSNWYCYQVRS